MVETIGITYAGDIKGWPKDSRAEVIVSEFAATKRDETWTDFQWAEIRCVSLSCPPRREFIAHRRPSGGVHGGSKSSESHDHVTVRYTTITGDKYDAHIAVNGYTIDYAKSKLWKK
jgi:hypothetical protein